MSKVRSLAARVAAWVCLAAVAVLSLLPADDLVRTDMGGHAEHILVYATTAAIVATAYRAIPPLHLLAALTAYAALLENLQRFSPGRHCSLVDLIFSSSGVAVGISAYLIGCRLLWICRKHLGSFG